MKFYKRFPGDINIKTGDLTLVEFGAYDRLLDHYYATERPIDPARVYTVARCQSAADRRAVDLVLSQYWNLTEAGWVQARADEMIAEALPRIEAARENGKLGGRPKGSTKKPTGFSTETQEQTKTPNSRKASQSQTSSPTSKKGAPSAPIPRPEDVSEQVWSDWVAHRKGKRATVSATVLDGARSESAKAGMPLEAFLAVWCRRGTQGLEADWLKPSERAYGRQQQPAEPEWRREQRERNEAFLGPAAARRGPQPTEVIDGATSEVG